MTTWPDTTRLDPPASNVYLSAEWLLGRHPQLARLVDRVPGLVTHKPEGPDLDLDALAAAVNDLDEYRRAWTDYAYRHPAPRDEGALDAWEASGPTASPAANSIGVMSRTEVARLRLLATLAPERVRFSVIDLSGFDPAGDRLIADWCRVIQGG